MFIGVDIGGTSIKVGLVNNLGEILKKDSYFVNKSLNQNQMASQLGNFILSFMDNNLESIEGIGIACPGIIDKEQGQCMYSPNLNWHNLYICEQVKNICHKDVRIINDANAATLAELKLGAGVNYQDFIMLTLGTGVGGGIVKNHELFEGNSDEETELGHLTLVANGRKCSCGKNGCIEAYCSATALIKETKIAMQNNLQSTLWNIAPSIDLVNGQTAFIAYKEGDETAKKVIEEFINYLSLSLIKLDNMFHPEIFLLGGGLSLQKEFLTNLVEKEIQKISSKKIYVFPSKLSNDSGIVGAACLFIK